MERFETLNFTAVGEDDTDMRDDFRRDWFRQYWQPNLIGGGIMCLLASPIIAILAMLYGGAAAVYVIIGSTFLASAGAYWFWKGIQNK